MNKTHSFFSVFPSTLGVGDIHMYMSTVLAVREIVSCQLIRLLAVWEKDITHKTDMIDRGIDDPLLFACIKKENGIRYKEILHTRGIPHQFWN